MCNRGTLSPVLKTKRKVSKRLDEKVQKLENLLEQTLEKLDSSGLISSLIKEEKFRDPPPKAISSFENSPGI